MASQLREAIEKLRRNQGPRLESGRSLMIFGAEDLGRVELKELPNVSSQDGPSAILRDDHANLDDDKRTALAC